MEKFMVITDLTDTYEGMDINTFDNLGDAKNLYDHEKERHYNSCLIKYNVIENFENEVDKI